MTTTNAVHFPGTFNAALMTDCHNSAAQYAHLATVCAGGEYVDYDFGRDETRALRFCLFVAAILKNGEIYMPFRNYTSWIVKLTIAEAESMMSKCEW